MDFFLAAHIDRSLDIDLAIIDINRSRSYYLDSTHSIHSTFPIPVMEIEKFGYSLP